jgi:prevent-host-death family protein
MRTIKELLNLSGEIGALTVSEFRAKPGEVFAQVELGKCFLITKSGRDIARLVPVKPLAKKKLSELEGK